MRTPAAAFLAVPLLACIDVGSIQGQRPPEDGGNGAACTSCSTSECTSPPDDDPNLVAGLESGCAAPEVRNGRSTSWFTFANSASNVMPAALSTFLPACVGANGSCYSACIHGALSGSSYPFAGLGVAFKPNFGTYDLSPYQGISFDVLGTIGPTSGLRFSVPTPSDSSVGAGGTCASGVQCDDPYQTEVSAFGPGAWTHVTVTFDMLRQIGYGLPERWDPAHALSLWWTVFSTVEALPSEENYSVCVDNIQLIPR